MIEEIIFHWARDHGDCADCGLPAAFQSLNCYGPDRHRSLCAVCAANEAVDGGNIGRLS